MDLNELFFHHQIAVMRADHAADGGNRRRFGAQADWLAARIASVQRFLGAPATPLARIAAL